MNIPIVIAAFGTSTKAFDTYTFIDQVIRESFPEREIYWAYTSRMIKARVNKQSGPDLSDPCQILEDLDQKGHHWAVVQSLHVFCGHEFYRLVDQVRAWSIRTSIGYPLLTDPIDYSQVVNQVQENFDRSDDSCLVLVGHGSDHPNWSCYPALEQMFREKGCPGVFIGTVEGYPGKEEIIKKIKKTGYKRVHLVPFMLVTGTHFLEDIQGDEDSWKNFFEDQGLQVSVEPNGLGQKRWVADIFCRHIQEAAQAICHGE